MDELTKLLERYRESLPDPEPGPDFMPGLWRKLAAVAHTLPYDCAAMGDFTVPAARLAAVKIPALVMHGSKTNPRLKRAAAAVAAAIPGARARTLDGQRHDVSAAALAPAVAEFLRSII